MTLLPPDTLERGDGRRAFWLPALFVIGLWLLKAAELRFGLDLPVWGITPGNFRGPEFLLAPLIHGDWTHLFSNSMPCIVLGWGVLYLYPRAAWQVFALVYFGTGLLVWFYARGGPHIGASGVTYGLVCFIFFSGVLRREPPAIALSLLVTFLYGSMIWGVLPRDPNISWESHLAGSVLGTIYAVVFRFTHPPVRPPMSDEEDEDYHEDDEEAARTPWRGGYMRDQTPSPYRKPPGKIEGYPHDDDELY